jgi:hypothetical protein
MLRPASSILISAVLVASLAPAQQAVPGEAANSVLPGPGGLRLQSVTAFSTYSTDSLNSRLANPGSDQGGTGAGIAATLVFDRFGPRTDFDVTYTPSYFSGFQAVGGNSENHSLSINWRRRLTPKLTWTISGFGNITSFEEALFRPTTLANVVAAPATFEDLTAAMTAGTANSMQMETALTNARITDSPSGLLLYGSRMLGATVQTGFTYSRSSRLTIRTNLSGDRAQAMHQPGGQPDYMLAHSTAAAASIGVGYSLTPRTQLGVDVSMARTFSNIQDAYTSYANASMARTIGATWFLQMHAGMGTITPVRQSSALSQAPQLEAGGGLGHKAHTQTFLLSVERSISDSYGFGATSSVSATGAWNWARPGRGWSVMGDFGQQWLSSSALQSFNSWRVTLGLTRNLGQHTIMSAQYVYLSSSGLAGGPNPLPSVHMVRMSVGWTPAGRVAR